MAVESNGKRRGQAIGAVADSIAIALPTALNLAAARRRHYLHEFFGDVWLESAGVPFVEPHDVGDKAAIATLAEGSHFRLSGPGQQAS